MKIRYTKRLLYEWQIAGYKPIHLFKDYYLLRRYSKGFRKFSLYDLVRIKKGELVYSKDGRVIGSK